VLCRVPQSFKMLCSSKMRSSAHLSVRVSESLVSALVSALACVLPTLLPLLATRPCPLSTLCSHLCCNICSPHFDLLENLESLVGPHLPLSCNYTITSAFSKVSPLYLLTSDHSTHFIFTFLFPLVLSPSVVRLLQRSCTYARIGSHPATEPISSPLS
jgi:hypothetical protein